MSQLKPKYVILGMYTDIIVPMCWYNFHCRLLPSLSFGSGLFRKKADLMQSTYRMRQFILFKNVMVLPFQYAVNVSDLLGCNMYFCKVNMYHMM